MDAYIFAEEEEDDSESDDKIPEFEGYVATFHHSIASPSHLILLYYTGRGEPRGRVVNPIAGVKPKPPRPLR